MSSMFKRQVDSPHCSACTDEMYLTMIVPPFGSPYARFTPAWAQGLHLPEVSALGELPHYGTLQRGLINE